MKKILCIAILTGIIIMLLSSYAFSGTAENGKPGENENKNGDQSNSARQEFIWDDSQGTFRKIDRIKIEDVDEHLKKIEKKFIPGKTDNSDTLGTPTSYTYWDGKKWITLENISRYKGDDQRAEALVTRYDLTRCTFSTAAWETLTGYQSIYSSYEHYTTQKKGKRQDNLNNVPQNNGSNSPQTKFFSRSIGAPDAFDPIVEVILANGWKVTINSRFDKSGTEVIMKSPDGNTSYIYGDPELMDDFRQPGGLAVLDNYVFDLEGYTLKIETEQDKNGIHRISRINLEGPNGYKLTYSRNNEVRVYGGTK